MLDTVNGEYSMLVSGQYNRNDVKLVEVVKLDEKTYGRLDMIAVSYYGDVKYLPLLLDWNNITDVSKMRVGDIVEIPDLMDMLKSVEDNNRLLMEEFQDDQNYPLPGIIENNFTPTTSEQIEKNTSGNPLLGITQEGTTVDEANGFLIYK